MDIQEIADQVIGKMGDAPEKIHEFIEDPKGHIEELTGQALDEGQLSELVQHVQGAIAEGKVDLSNIDPSKIADQLGSLVENSPLKGIGETISGFFNKQA